MRKFDLNKYKEEFIKIYTDGSIKDVMNMFNISMGTVNKYAKQLGLRKGNQRPTKRKLVFDDLNT